MIVRRIAAAALILSTLAAVMIGALVQSASPERPAVSVAAAAEPRRIDAIPAVQLNDEPTDDEAFLADLLGPDTDVTAEQAFHLTEQARRIADLLTHPEDVPAGAETPTREGILASLTTPGSAPNGGAYTPGEAGKLIDCALATYATA